MTINEQPEITSMAARFFTAHWRIYRLLNTPSVFKSLMYHGVSKPHFSFPCTDALGFPVARKIPVSASILTLLKIGRPATVFLAVAKLVVSAIQRVFRAGSRSHVFKEVSESFFAPPPVADSNAFRPVVLVPGVIGIVAPLAEANPCVIPNRSRLCDDILVYLNPIIFRFASQASARLNVTRLQVACRAAACFSAIAKANPAGRLNVAIATNNNEASVANAGKVLEFHSAALFFRAAFKSCRQSGRSTVVDFRGIPLGGIATRSVVYS